MENKVVVVERVNPIPKKDNETLLDADQILQDLYKESYSDNLMPPRDLKRIKHENDVKKFVNLIDSGSNKDRITNEDLKAIDPASKLENLESEFFHAKQQLLKNIRSIESLKSQIYKLYSELYPNLSAEEIKTKFTY